MAIRTFREHLDFNPYLLMADGLFLRDECADLDRVARYRSRNPFSTESRAEGETGCPQGSNGPKRSGNMEFRPPNPKATPGSETRAVNDPLWLSA